VLSINNDNYVNDSSELKNKDLHVQSQRIVLNMYECLKKENIGMADNAIVSRIHVLKKSGIRRYIQLLN
jgi:hypothetical protein